MPSEDSGNAPASFHARPKPLALALWVALGAVLLWLSQWAGPVGFWWFFERPFLRHAVAVERGVVCTTPVVVLESRPDAWTVRELGGLGARQPPGTVLGVERNGNDTTVRLEEGTILYSPLPEGFFREVYRSEREAVGGRSGAPKDEVALVRSILETVPGAYRLSWTPEARCDYAARLTSKMRILRDRPVRRLEVCVRAEPHALAVLAEYISGQATIISVTERGSVVAQLSEKVPPAWLETPEHWIPGEAPPSPTPEPEARRPAGVTE